MIVDIKLDNGVFLHNRLCRGNNTNKYIGYNIKRKMIYNCDFHCNQIEKIKYCLKKRLLKDILCQKTLKNTILI